MDRNTFYDNLNKYTSKHTITTSATASDRFDFYDKLQHHGIKGQKWGIRRYQNPDGSLTEEGKQRYLNPDGTLNSKAPIKLQSAYNRYKYQQAQEENKSGKNLADNYVYDEQKQKEKLEKAKSNKMYDLNFVETIQNAENLSSDDVNREYEAYLKNPRKYMETFEVDGLGNIKNTTSGNTTSKPAKQEPVKQENTKTEKELKSDLKEEAKTAFGPKATKEEEEKFWKALAEEYTKGNLKNNESSSKSKEEKKAAKAEKKEINKAKAEAWKSATKGHTARNLLLTGPVLGTLSDWGLVNKAIKELGYSSAEKKNLSASDWNKINEKIQDIRGSKKKSK